MFLNKTPPAWAKGLFITIKDFRTVTRPGFLTADKFIKSHIPLKHIHNPGYLDYLEILKLIPKDWQNKVKQNITLPEQDAIKVIVFSSKRKWQKINIAKTKCKDLYRTLHQRKIILIVLCLLCFEPLRIIFPSLIVSRFQVKMWPWSLSTIGDLSQFLGKTSSDTKLLLQKKVEWFKTNGSS